MSSTIDQGLRDEIAREIAVYLTKRRDVLDAVLSGNVELGRAMMDDLAHRILAIPEKAEALEEAQFQRIMRKSKLGH